MSAFFDAAVNATHTHTHTDLTYREDETTHSTSNTHHHQDGKQIQDVSVGNTCYIGHLGGFFAKVTMRTESNARILHTFTLNST